MNCPFCAEEIKDQAAVCKHCRRDLSIVRPVYDELRAQSEQIAALKDEIAAIRERIETGTTAPVADGGGQSGTVSGAAEPSLARPSAVAGALVLTFVLVVLAYWVIVWIFDLDSTVLLVASLLIPALLAGSFPSVRLLGIWTLLILSILLGLSTLFAMSGIKSLYEHITILPRNEAELRDDVEAAFSIALSFVTGARLSQIGRLLTAADAEAAGLSKGTEGLRKMIEIATPIVTAIGALITGIRALLAH